MPPLLVGAVLQRSEAGWYCPATSKKPSKDAPVELVASSVKRTSTSFLAWFVIDAVAAMDLAAFYASYRADGHGRAADDPATMVVLLLCVCAIGERSSRGGRAALS